jgi:uncharacterized protein
MSFSLQRLLSGDDRAFDLLEGSAQQARAAIQNIMVLLRSPQSQPALDALDAVRQKEMLHTHELTDYLCRTFITPLEREDLESLSKVLHKIPVTAKKFAVRYGFAGRNAEVLDFSQHLELLEQAADLVVLAVKELRLGTQLDSIRQLNQRLQRVEGDADKLMLASLKKIFRTDYDPVQVLLLKELLELLEKIFDHCRDIGNVVLRTILKHA